MKDLTDEQIAFIKDEYFKLDEKMRDKIMIVSQSLAEGDDQTLHSSIWYFSQKKNKKELDSVFKDVVNNSLDFIDTNEADVKGGGIPKKIKIQKKK